jgi:hypothetical protein
MFHTKEIVVAVFTAALNRTAPGAVKRAGSILIAQTAQSSRNGLAGEIRVSYAANSKIVPMVTR